MSNTKWKTMWPLSLMVISILGIYCLSLVLWWLLDSLCRPGCPQIQEIPPVSASQVLPPYWLTCPFQRIVNSLRRKTLSFSVFFSGHIVQCLGRLAFLHSSNQLNYETAVCPDDLWQPGINFCWSHVSREGSIDRRVRGRHKEAWSR